MLILNGNLLLVLNMDLSFYRMFTCILAKARLVHSSGFIWHFFHINDFAIGLKADTVAYNAAIACCYKAKEWGVIIRLADNMTYEKVPKNRRVSALFFSLLFLGGA